MPGTHADNDHSFIQKLPFAYKQVAYLILRSDDLSQLLSDKQRLDSSHFDTLKAERELDQERVEQTLCACIVAKITSFSKGLYINQVEYKFLEEQLYQALSVLLKLECSEREAIHKELQYLHIKTADWLLKPFEANRHPKLEIRPRQDNNRRYFRYRADMTYHFIRIGNDEKDEELQGDIYSSGIKHFNKVMNAKLDRIEARYQTNIRYALAETYPEAYTLFIEVLEKLQNLREVLNGISVGVLDIQSALKLLSKNIKSSLDYQSLHGNVRTEQILRDFEEKLNQISLSSIELLKKSTPHKLYEGPVLGKLKIDYDIQNYIDKNNAVPSKLLQAFIDLYHFTLLLEKVYNNISSSHYVIVFPEYWTDDYHDLSPGGFAFYSEFLVEKNDILELYMRVNVSKTDTKQFEIIHQKAKVVRVQAVEEKEKYLIGCEFIICLNQEQQLISHAIQAQEVKDAYNSTGLLKE